MKYNFDKVIDRRNTHSLKWDITKENELPMWVADMDFEAAPAIKEALEHRVKQGVFGYNIIPDEWYNAYISWWKERHGAVFTKDQMIFSTGVIPSLSSIVRKMTTPAENVLIQTPVYNIFYNSVLNNGRNILENELIYRDGEYEMDFEDLEAKLSMPQTTMMILCNPQNPAGRIWKKDELARVAKLCFDNGVLVVSDEIHCDITEPDKTYTPFMTVSEEAAQNSVTLIAPTKCFNIAGLQTSAIVVPNGRIYSKVNRGLNTDECAEPNAFAIDATVAAFDKSGDWLDEMNRYVSENKHTVDAFLQKELPQLKAVTSEATYLMWIDCTSLGLTSKELCRQIRLKSGLFVSAGDAYGKAGDGFIRMNTACPRSLLLDGLSRLKKAVDEIQ